MVLISFIIFLIFKNLISTEFIKIYNLQKRYKNGFIRRFKNATFKF